MTRGEVFRWVRDRRARLAAQLGADAGLRAARAGARRSSRRAAAQVSDGAAPRRSRDRAERTLTQGASRASTSSSTRCTRPPIPERATRHLRHPRPQIEFLRPAPRGGQPAADRRAVSAARRVEAQRGVSGALRDAARARRAATARCRRAQADVMLDRQLRQVPRWLGQNRYNGPSGGAQPAGPAARPTSPSARASRPNGADAWCGTRTAPSTSPRPSGSGEIHVRARGRSASGRFAVTPPEPRRHASARARPTTRSLSADGSAVAFETAESTYPLAKRVGQMTVARARPRDRRGRRASSHASRGPRARRRAPRSTRRSRPTGGSSRSRRPTAGRNGAPSEQRPVGRRPRARAASAWSTRARRAAPRTCRELAGDGSAVVYTSAKLDNGGLHARLRDVAVDAARRRWSRAPTAARGAPAASDAYEPSALARRLASSRSPAARATSAATGTPTSTSATSWPARRGSSPARSTADAGRAVAVRRRPLRRVRRPRRAFRTAGRSTSLRSRVWLPRHRHRRDTRSSAARAGARGDPADGYATDPAISADGRARRVRLAPPGTSPRPSRAGIAGVFVRDVGRNTTTLLSTHAQRPGLRPEPVVYAAPAGSGLALAAGGLRAAAPPPPAPRLDLRGSQTECYASI